jgi:hypothetical protein
VKRISLVLLVLLGGTLSGLYYFWHQATKLPDWYREDAAQPPIATPQTKANIQQKIQAQIQQSLIAESPNPSSPNPSSPNPSSPNPSSPNPNRSNPSSSKTPDKADSTVKVQLNQDELNDVLVSKIVEKNRISALPASIKSVHTAVENNTLKTGAVIDLKELKNSNLGSQEKAFLEQATQRIPGLGDRKVYIGIEGKPRVKDGKMQFDDQMRLHIGNLSLTVAELADRLGVPPEKVKERLKLELQLQNLNVNDIELQNGTAILRGSVAPSPTP